MLGGQFPIVLSVLAVKGRRLAGLDWDGCESTQVSVPLSGGLYWKADPKLLLGGASIPFTDKPVRFLGLDVQVASHHVCPRSNIVARLQKMLTAIDRAPLTRRQKILMYSAGVCPRLTWPLLTQEFSITWVEKELDSLATRYIKHWAGLTKSANSHSLSSQLDGWPQSSTHSNCVQKVASVSPDSVSDV